MQEWQGNRLNVEEYGWKRINGLLHPVQGYTVMAPAEIQKVLACSCKTGCNRASCSCRKHGLVCSEACKCNELCENVMENEHYSEDDMDMDMFSASEYE